MPRLAIPEVFHPRLKFRYSILTSKMPTAVVHARSAEQPAFDNQPVSINYRSNYINMKGRTTWSPITLSCYSFEGITENELYRYFNADHFDVSDGVEYDMTDYKHMLTLVMLNPLLIPTATWRLYGAFISNASWGDVDYGSDDIVQCDITITYDYATLNEGVINLIDNVADNINNPLGNLFP